MQSQRIKKINNQLADIVQARQQGQLDQCIVSFGPNVDDKGVKQLQRWTLKFKGRKGSDLYPGTYEVDMIFPQTYPGSAPKCKFKNGFTHYHVYPGGEICLKLLKDGWSMNKSMIEVGHSIVNMVHSPPKVGDQANNDMAKMFANSPQKYSEFLRTQAEKFKK